jgi:hypothetical protein
MRIELVVEIEPGLFATREHSTPPGSRKEFPDSWARYHRDCLADSSITASTIAPGSWFVAFSEMLRNEQFAKLLTVQSRLGESTEVDNLTPLCGGLAFFDPGLLLEPQHCGDLEVVSDFQTLLNSIPTNWTQFWIGHPMLWLRQTDGRVEFSAGASENEREPPGPIFTTSSSVLIEAVENAHRQLRAAVPSVAAVLKTVTTLNPEAAARRLLGLID